MLRIISLSSSVLAALALAGCNLEATKADPIRIEFVEACEGRAENRSMEPKKRTTYCECGYDTTMSGLSGDEKQLARFYLLAQVGVDVQSRNLISEPNWKAMPKVSTAIGNAGKRCRRR